LKVFFYTDGGNSNFGDDLNRWMWRKVSCCPLDVDDGRLLLGIGTVISRNLIPLGMKYVVLSSGAGYANVPIGFGGPEWEILSVRGPLTAQALDLPPEKAIIDGAALLRLIPECEPLPESERAGIVFMPHYVPQETGNWRQVCEMAGFEYLDPLADSEETVQRIRRAKLVIADAMHAAIVADTLRVPWIPVSLSPQSNTFKWLDWTLSLGLPYNPTSLPASTLVEAIRCRSFPFYGERHFLENRDPAYVLEYYKRMRRLKARKHWSYWKWRIQQLTYLLPRKIVTSGALSRFRRQQDESRTYRAAEQLRRVAELPSYLSDERVFMSKVEQIAALLPRLEALDTDVAQPDRAVTVR
jgi:succinoglycan biosynthesis protein ExoV